MLGRNIRPLQNPRLLLLPGPRNLAINSPISHTWLIPPALQVGISVKDLIAQANNAVMKRNLDAMLFMSRITEAALFTGKLD